MSEHFKVQVPEALFNVLYEAKLIVSKPDGYYLSRGAVLLLQTQAARRGAKGDTEVAR